MQYQECLDYMQLHCQMGIPGGFARTMRMAALLHNPQEKLRVIVERPRLREKVGGVDSLIPTKRGNKQPENRYQPHNSQEKQNSMS